MKRFPLVSWWRKLNRYLENVLPLAVERALRLRSKLARLCGDGSGRRKGYFPLVEELRPRLLPSITAINDSAIANLGQHITLRPLINDSSDAEDGPAIVQINGSTPTFPVTLPSGATLSQNEDGSYDYVMATATVDSFQYTIEDGNEDTAVATVSIAVGDGQWANGVVTVTSIYDSGSEDWTAAQALGEPNTNSYGDQGTAWSPALVSGSSETITLAFPTAVHANGFLIRESNANGFVTQVELRDSSNHSTFTTVWTGTDDSAQDGVVDFVQFFSAATATVDGMRITIDSHHETDNWEEIDAVKLLNADSVTDPSNTAPTSSVDNVNTETDEDTSVNVACLVCGSVSDVDGDPLFLTVVTPPEHGSVAVNNNGTPNDWSDDYYVYTPDPDYHGTDGFDFALMDIHGAVASSAAHASITIDAVEDAPTAVDDYLFTEKNSGMVATGVVGNDYDVDGDSLSLAIVTGPSHGTAGVDGNNIQYTPDGDYVGEDAVEYHVSDGNGGYATATLLIEVYPTGQWASYVEAVTSEYGTGDDDWSSNKALGAPDTTEYGDLPTAWAPEQASNGYQTITLGFDDPQPANGVIIRESNGNRFITKVELIDTDNNPHTIWEDTDVCATSTVVDFSINLLETTGFEVKQVRITVDTNHGDDWEEIDAVRLLTPEIPARSMMRMEGESSSGGDSSPEFSVSTRVSLGHGGSLKTDYDAQSRPILETTYQRGNVVDQKAYSYDEESGFLSAMVETDAIGRQTQTTFDNEGRTLSKTLAYGTDGAATTSYVYENGNLIQLTDPDGNSTYWEYDDQNREILMTDPLGHSVAKTYDEDGRLASIRDRDGRLRTFAYDDDGHLMQEVWYAGATTESAVVDTLNYSFNDDGSLASAGNGAGEYDYTYNIAGQLTDVSEPFGVSLHFGYDAAGHRNLVEDSFGGEIDSTYNDAGQLASRFYHQTGQPTLRIDIQYDSQGRIKKQLRYSDAAATQLVATTDYAYDAAGHLIGQVDKKANGDVIASYAWVYDAAGELISQTDHGVEKVYSYDAQGQLTGDGTNDYSYDLNGNRNGENDDVGDDNRLNADGVWNYSYDLEGNVTKKSQGAHDDTWVYGYDNKNELISATEWDEDPDSVGTAAILQKVEFKYDVFSNRVQKRVDTDGDGDYDTTQRYALDGWDNAKGTPVGNENWDVWADLDGSSSLTTRYLRGDVVDQLFARVDGSGALWLLADHLGSVRDVISNSTSTTVLDTIAYDAFGNAAPANSTADATYGGRYKWTGREFDVETGLQYNRARYYDAATGRWMSQDPMGFDAGDSNLYRYTKNGPIIAADPNGLQQVANDPFAYLDSLKSVRINDFGSLLSNVFPHVYDIAENKIDYAHKNDSGEGTDYYSIGSIVSKISITGLDKGKLNNLSFTYDNTQEFKFGGDSYFQGHLTLDYQQKKFSLLDLGDGVFKTDAGDFTEQHRLYLDNTGAVQMKLNSSYKLTPDDGKGGLYAGATADFWYTAGQSKQDWASVLTGDVRYKDIFQSNLGLNASNGKAQLKFDFFVKKDLGEKLKVDFGLIGNGNYKNNSLDFELRGGMGFTIGDNFSGGIGGTFNSFLDTKNGLSLWASFFY